jgi:hypothetical protein
MTTFIAEASVTLPWCFQDEATAWTDSLLDGLGRGTELLFPRTGQRKSQMDY